MEFRRKSTINASIRQIGVLIAFILLIPVVGYSHDVSASNTNHPVPIINGLEKPYVAPPIEGISAWINSLPLDITNLKGKVVLIDFWAYSCINCVRTLPYVKSWYERYQDKGFIVIGVHSPEFEFEKNPKNVRQAVEKYGIKYPVALDNYLITWKNYHNQYWPAHYLIDKNGRVVYQNFGEGDYQIIENNIRALLGITGSKSIISPEDNSKFSLLQTPETYLGYKRAITFASPEPLRGNEITQYTFPHVLQQNNWALKGKWVIQAEKVVAAEPRAALEINFFARKVFVVIGSPKGKSAKIQILLNGEPISYEAGKDVTHSTLNVLGHDLFEVLNLKKTRQGILQLIVNTPGVEVYTFTFGN